MLQDRALFFPNASKLTDQYEVTVPEYISEQKRKELESSGLKGRELEEELARFHWEHSPMKELTLINCWSVSPHESYALWKIYLGGSKDGVAIKSSVSKLIRSVGHGNDPYPEEFYVGKVRYKSFLTRNELSRFDVITTKKPFYDFEKEIRLFILNYPKSEGGTKTPYQMKEGRTVRVDLELLISELYISPFASEDFSDKVQTLLKEKCPTKISVRQSQIRDE